MPFIPDSGWGILYASMLFVCCCVAMRGGNDGTRWIASALVVHWITMRAIDVYDHNNMILWMQQDALFMALFIVIASFRRSKTASILSGIFFIGLLMDQMAFANQPPFAVSAAAGEFIGYCAMFIMAGASNGIGKFNRVRHPRLHYMHTPVVHFRSHSEDNAPIHLGHHKKDVQN
jgi:hypothetical protein